MNNEIKAGSNPFLQEDLEIIRIVNRVCSVFSMTGSFVIFGVFWFFKENRSFNLELVLWYSLSNFIYMTSSFFPFNPKENDIWCGIQSFTITCFQTSCMLWTCLIGYCAFISVIKKNHLENNKIRYRVGFLFLSYGLSAGLASM